MFEKDQNEDLSNLKSPLQKGRKKSSGVSNLQEKALNLWKKWDPTESGPKS